MIEHYWRDLPGPVWFSGADIYRRFVEQVTGPAIAVELGAWKGRSTCFMAVEIANSGKPVDFYTVDHWQGSNEQGYDDPDLGSGKLFETFLRNIERVASHVTVIRADTQEAATRLDDESIDFLYVDASHSYRGVLADLRAWYPKVKFGGTIAGDDWCFELGGVRSVRRAVFDFLGPSASRVTVEQGSEPNRDWHQWWFEKTPDLSIAPGPGLIDRALRRFGAIR
jgi:hypothetical protein